MKLTVNLLRFKATDHLCDKCFICLHALLNSRIYHLIENQNILLSLFFILNSLPPPFKIGSDRNVFFGFGMQMLCSHGGGISEEPESDEFLINELWNGSPGAIKDELLFLPPSLFLSRTHSHTHRRYSPNVKASQCIFFFCFHWHQSALLVFWNQLNRQRLHSVL